MESRDQQRFGVLADKRQTRTHKLSAFSQELNNEVKERTGKQQSKHLSYIARNKPYLDKRNSRADQLSDSYEPSTGQTTCKNQKSGSSKIQKHSHTFQSQLPGQQGRNTSFSLGNERAVTAMLNLSQPRAKIIKRYSQKSRVQQILQKIGFPQKKSKMIEETKQMKRDITTKMEVENNEFMDLLDQTTQSFYKTMHSSFLQDELNKSYAAYDHYKDGRNSLQGQDDTLGTINIENQSEIPTKAQRRPLTQLKHRNSILMQPAFLYRPETFQDYQDNTSINKKPSSNDSNINEERLNISLPDAANLHQKNHKALMYKTQIGKQSIFKQVGGPSSREQSYQEKTNPSEKGNASRNVVYSLDERITAASTNKLTYASAHLKLIDHSKRTRVKSRKIGSFISNVNMDKPQMDTAETFEISAQSGLIPEVIKPEAQLEDITPNKKDCQKSSASADKKDVLRQSLLATQGAGSRVSFKNKKSRVQKLSESFISRILDPSKSAINENVFNLNRLIEDAQKAIANTSESLEDRKKAIVSSWTAMIDILKQNAELNSFELVFLTLKVLGDIFLDFKDLTEALRVYRSAKLYCEDFKRYKEKLVMYEQIGYTYRLMKENEKAVQCYKKLLQLAWQEKEYTMEVVAYDNLSTEYFYLGQLAKANYYHDRHMRGKHENDKSIVKKVSTNLLVSRREQRHNVENRKIGEQKKAGLQRLPSPSGLAKASQFNKGINLLPYFTEAQAAGVLEEDDEDDNSRGVSTKNSSTTSKVILRPNSKQKGPNFTQKELVHLNRPPHYQYLQQPKKIVKSRLKPKSLINKQTKESGVYKQDNQVDYKPFDEDRFRDIVSYALQKKETSHTSHHIRNLQHLSVYRTTPLNSINHSKLTETVNTSIETYKQKFLVWLHAIYSSTGSPSN